MTEPRPADSARRTARWRGLPLTAQLLVVGMLVSLGWFLSVRLATERQAAARLARDARLSELRRGEGAITRIGMSLLTMSRAHRGYLLSGRPDLLIEVEGEELVFSASTALLRELDPLLGLEAEVDSLGDVMRSWMDSAYRPNVLLRERYGLAGFELGTPGARSEAEGARSMRRALELQDRMRREARAAIVAVEEEDEAAHTREEWDSLLLTAAVLTIFVLLLMLLLRRVDHALAQVVEAAEALQAGRYRAARFPDAHQAPNREMARLARAFEQLAASIEERERQLQDDIVKLTELDRLKRDFVSTVSHELRTPLTSMRGALGLILGGKVGELPERGRALLQIAMLNTERLIRLINDILDVEKIDAGEIAIRSDRLHLGPLLQTTIAGLDGFAREHRVTLAYADGAADPAVIGDADRLVQVFTNLGSNAVKYSPEGQVVEFTLTSDETHAHVRVRDHGPGISEEFAARIFGRFQQASDPALHRSGGTGLGLSIVKSIVELHGGAVEFEVAPGGGTIFHVSLPLAPAAAAVADARRAILIVEDDPSMRDVLVAQFESHARPIAVQSAEAAQAVLAREPVAAIILDPGLPGMDGLAFARWVRQSEAHRRMPMFLFSAREHAPDELRAAGIRAADAFVKSRDPESILFERMKHELLKRG